MKRKFMPHFASECMIRGGVLLLVACMASGCVSNKHEDETAAKNADPRSILAGLNPEGWVPSDEVLQFNAESLYEQINGRAEFYLAYDVISMSYASFDKEADASHYMDLSIFDMGTTTNAFGVFSAERSPGNPAVDLGRIAYRSYANHYIWKGRYYIVLTCSDTAKEVQALAFDTVRKVVEELTDPDDQVWGRNALPAKNRVPESIRYFKTDAMGLDFMKEVYTAQYQHEEVPVDAFISGQPSAKSAADTFAKYLHFVDEYGKGSESLTVEDGVLSVCDMKGSYDVVFLKGSVMGGVTAVKDRDLAVRAAIILREELPHQ